MKQGFYVLSHQYLKWTEKGSGCQYLSGKHLTDPCSMDPHVYDHMVPVKQRKLIQLEKTCQSTISPEDDFDKQEQEAKYKTEEKSV